MSRFLGDLCLAHNAHAEQNASRKLSVRPRKLSAASFPVKVTWKAAHWTDSWAATSKVHIGT